MTADPYDYETVVTLRSIGLGDTFATDVAPIVDELDDRFFMITVTCTNHISPCG